MANLKTTIIEEITLNGNQTRLKNTHTISSVTDIMTRNVTLPASQNTTLATFNTSEHTSDVALDLEDVVYIRITNLHSSLPVTLSLQVSGGENDTANMSASILLEDGKSFMLGSVHDGISVGDTDATVITALTDLESIIAVCGSTAIELEMLIAKRTS